MGGAAGAIAGGDLSRRVDDTNPRTEVGRLGLALNAMLGRLEGAFAERRASEERLRRFLSDASHELRTPLAAIRGYAELFRMGAVARPRETAKAMRRIEDEAARMGVLVEDLLTLARLRNALVHAPARTTVEVTTRREGEEVVLEVRDHGPGLPDADPDALFGRFWRAEAGRERGRAGAGLGLAIVAGIVTAHHGEVSARNAEDGGAAFTVRLPASPSLPAVAEIPPGVKGQ